MTEAFTVRSYPPGQGEESVSHKPTIAAAMDLMSYRVATGYPRPHVTITSPEGKTVAVFDAGGVEEANWRPIETAPKDGTTWIDTWAGERRADCTWLNGHWAQFDRCTPNKDRWGKTTSWTRRFVSGFEPTHWMPRPTPPGEAPANAQPVAGGVNLTDPLLVQDPERLAAEFDAAADGYWCTRCGKTAVEAKATGCKRSPCPMIRSDLTQALMGPHEWGYRCLTSGVFIEDATPFAAAELITHLRSAPTQPVETINQALVEVLTAVRDWADQANPAGYGGLRLTLRSRVEAALLLAQGGR